MKTKREKLIANSKKTAADNVKEVLGGKYFKTMKGFNYAIMRSVR